MTEAVPHVTSGHQPSFFHPGILAKRFALEKRAGDRKVGLTWLVADQDANQPGQIPYPDLDRSGTLVRRIWQALPSTPGAPTCTRRFEAPTPPPRVDPGLPSSIQRGLDRMHEALLESPGETVSERWAAANERMLGTWCTQSVALVHASRLLHEPHGRRIAERIAADPMGCAKVWNAAVALVPRSARPLRMDSNDPQRTEVPFWRVDEDDHRRTTATVADLHRSLKHDTPLLPKAFLMTAIVRSDDCLEMIHGTGGGRYEVVTEAWAAGFLDLALAPVSVVTATLRLPLSHLAPEIADETSGGMLRLLQHDPWSDPGHKRALVEAIGAAPRRSRQRLELYRAMQTERRERCTEIADRLADLERRLEVDRRSIAAVDASRDRTWPWPLFDDAEIGTLFAETT